MITNGIEQAHDEIIALFRTAWLAGVESATVPLTYEDVKGDQPEGPRTGEAASNAPWARVTVRTTQSRQASLANHAGQSNWETLGIITINIFTPAGDGLRLAHKLAKTAQEAFRGVTTSPGGIWFRNPRIEPVGQDGPWYMTNVLAEFTYDEVA